jgi:hypothetical protein
MLDAWEIRQNTTEEVKINVKLPIEKTVDFWKAHLLHVCSQECNREFLQYTVFSIGNLTFILTSSVVFCLISQASNMHAFGCTSRTNSTNLSGSGRVVSSGIGVYMIL